MDKNSPQGGDFKVEGSRLKYRKARATEEERYINSLPTKKKTCEWEVDLGYPSTQEYWQKGTTSFYSWLPRTKGKLVTISLNKEQIIKVVQDYLSRLDH